jgi:hypothetical protein
LAYTWWVTRLPRYFTNVTLDGCCDHPETIAEHSLSQNVIENINRADALLVGRVIYEMMEAYWRPLATEWTEPFARSI